MCYVVHNGRSILGEGVKEALFTGAVLSFVCPEPSGSCVQVFEDSQGGMALAANSLSSARSKHMTCVCVIRGGFARCPGFPCGAIVGCS